MCQLTIHFNSTPAGLKKIYYYYARRSPTLFLRILDKIWIILSIIALIQTTLLGLFRLYRYSNQNIFNYDMLLYCFLRLLMAIFLIICYCIVRYFFHPLRNYFFQKYITKKPESLYYALSSISITFHENGGYVFSSDTGDAKTFLYSDYKKIILKKNKLVMIPYNRKETPTIYIPPCYFTDTLRSLLKNG